MNDWSDCCFLKFTKGRTMNNRTTLDQCKTAMEKSVFIPPQNGVKEIDVRLMKWRINLLMELRIALMLGQISVKQWLPLALCLNDHGLRFKRSSIQLGDTIVSIMYSSNHWLPIKMCANYLIIRKWLDSSYLNNASPQRSFLTDKSRFATGELSCIRAWCTH